MVRHPVLPIESQVPRPSASPAQVLPTSNMGVFDHDVRSNAIYCSPEVHGIYGWPEGLVATPEMFDGHTHPDDREQRTDAVARAHDRDGDGRYSLEYRIVRADGAIRWVNTLAQTFFEGHGTGRSVVRVIGAITDVTDMRAALELLQDREDRLRRAETLARMGHFTLDGDGTDVIWSDGNKMLFGFSPDSNPSFEELFSRLHPDDAPRLRAAFARASEDRTGFEIEFRVVRPDGTIATIRSLVECTRRTDTGRLRFFGTNLDVTTQKQAEAALVVNEERLRQAVRLGRLGIFDHDHASGDLLLVTRAARDLGPRARQCAVRIGRGSHPPGRPRPRAGRRSPGRTILVATAPSSSSIASSPLRARCAGSMLGRRPTSREPERRATPSAPSAPPPTSPSGSRSRSTCASRTTPWPPGSSACSSSASTGGSPTPIRPGCACTASITTPRSWGGSPSTSSPIRPSTRASASPSTRPVRGWARWWRGAATGPPSTPSCRSTR